MNHRKPREAGKEAVSTEAGLAATTRYPSGRPVGGEIFVLTFPFIERLWRSAASGESQLAKSRNRCAPLVGLQRRVMLGGTRAGRRIEDLNILTRDVQRPE